MTGGEGEKIAADFLRKRGYRILETNYRTRLGEIDIIALEGEMLVFVEVKARSGGRFGPPQFAVDFRKQIKMSRVALAYLSQKKTVSPSRFDVVAIMKTSERTEVELIKNAFELSEAGAGC